MKNIFLLLLLALMVSCGGGQDKKARLEELRKQRAQIEDEIDKLEAEFKLSDTAKAPTGVPVALLKIEPATFTHYLEIQAKVEADENVTINSSMPGTITAIYVVPGSVVHKNQVLAELDNEVYKKGIEEAKNGLDLATQVYEKQKRLWDQKIGTELQYLSAKNQKEAVEKRIATMAEQLEMSKIKSPINGTVDEVLLKVGQLAAPGMPGIRIVNLAGLKVKGEVAESYAGKIRKGTETIVFFPDLQKEFQSTISYTGQVINPLNRTYFVEVKITGGGTDYRPNMLAVMRIADYKAENSIVIPTSSIQANESGFFVVVASDENGKKVARHKQITKGESSKGLTEIKSGLAKGEQLITDGFQDLNDGETVSF